MQDVYTSTLRLMAKKKPYKSKEFGLPYLADMLGMSPISLSKLISTKTGKNFRTWLGDFRNEVILKELEKDNTLNAGKLCNITGILTSETFYRSFKRRNGMTFFAYKKALREKNRM